MTDQKEDRFLRGRQIAYLIYEYFRVTGANDSVENYADLFTVVLRLPCKDYLKGACTNSFCEKWHPPECLFYKTKSGCRFEEKCSCAHRQVDEQPSKRSRKDGDQSAVAMLKKHESYDRTGKLVVCRDTSPRAPRTCCVQLIKYTTIGLCIPGHGAAEVFIDFTEELRHTETNPTRKIHESRCTSR